MQELILAGAKRKAEDKLEEKLSEGTVRAPERFSLQRVSRLFWLSYNKVFLLNQIFNKLSCCSWFTIELL